MYNNALRVRSWRDIQGDGTLKYKDSVPKVDKKFHLPTSGVKDKHADVRKEFFNMLTSVKAPCEKFREELTGKKRRKPLKARDVKNILMQCGMLMPSSPLNRNALPYEDGDIYHNPGDGFFSDGLKGLRPDDLIAGSTKITARSAVGELFAKQFEIRAPHLSEKARETVVEAACDIFFRDTQNLPAEEIVELALDHAPQPALDTQKADQKPEKTPPSPQVVGGISLIDDSDAFDRDAAYPELRRTVDEINTSSKAKTPGLNFDGMSKQDCETLTAIHREVLTLSDKFTAPELCTIMHYAFDCNDGSRDVRTLVQMGLYRL